MTPATRRLIASVALVMGVGLIKVNAAAACSCLPSGPACADYWTASAVFLGRVESIVRAGEKPPARVPAQRRVTFTVIEAFSGVEKGPIEITTGSGGGDCGFPFREGSTYIVYGRRTQPGATLTAGICSRTREVSQAGGDVEYARAIALGGPVQGRVSGQVMLSTRSLVRAPEQPPRPLPDVGVRFERDGRSTRVATDAAGRFEATGLAAGRYTAFVDLPEGLYAEGWPRSIELRDARACAEMDVAAFADGRVSGRVVDAGGRPVVGLTVELTAPAGLDDPLGPERIRALTDGDGRFEIVHVPAGRFVVGINTQRNRDGGTLEPRFFHPGAAGPTGATRVMLKAGERVKLEDFKVPADVAFAAVSGFVVDSNGVPAAGARVYLKGPAEADYILSEPAVTDATGRFTIAAVVGRGYRVFAERPRGAANARIDSSEQIPFTAAASLPPFRLTLRQLY